MFLLILKSKADILLNLEVMTEERAARLGENFPYFVYSVGSISMKNQKTKEEILNSRFKDMKGAILALKKKLVLMPSKNYHKI